MMDDRITSLSHFADALGEIQRKWRLDERTTGGWFRGQSDASWTLLPGLYRGKIDHSFERELVRDFQLYSQQLLPQQSSKEPLEQMFVMQHYGLPTRLLDWTESNLTALYFAVADYSSNRDAAVFMMDPWQLNAISISQKSVPTIQHPRLKKYSLKDPHERVSRRVLARLPVAVRPSHNNERIRAQNGFFTIHGRDLNPIERIKGVCIAKIVIGATHRKAILRSLVEAGVSPRALFPDLAGLCEDILLRYSDDFRVSDAYSSGRLILAKGEGRSSAVAKRRPATSAAAPTTGKRKYKVSTP
jgi:hypothetical protein